MAGRRGWLARENVHSAMRWRVDCRYVDGRGVSGSVFKKKLNTCQSFSNLENHSSRRHQWRPIAYQPIHHSFVLHGVLRGRLGLKNGHRRNQLEKNNNSDQEKKEIKQEDQLTTILCLDLLRPPFTFPIPLDKFHFYPLPCVALDNRFKTPTSGHPTPPRLHVPQKRLFDQPLLET